jgi:membrane fusion protein, multidrug efflux system
MDSGKPSHEQSQEVDLAVAPSPTGDGHSEQFQEVDMAFVPAGTTDVHRKRRRWWLWLLVLCLIGVGGYGLLPHLGQEWQPEAWMPHLRRVATAAYDLLPRGGQEASQGTAPAAPPASRGVSVVAAAAKQGNLDIYLSGLGSVAAFNMVTVRPRVSGHLVKVAFQEGQFVRKGDLLAEIDPRPFQVQLAQAEGQMAKDQAQLRNAQRDLERFKVLLGRDLISKQEYDAQIASIDQVEGVIKSDQAQIDNAKLQLTYSRITAPISGRIGLRLVDEGNMVQANDPNGLAVITQLQPIVVLFSIPQDDLPSLLKRMQSGQKLVVEAYNRDLKQKLATGTLLTIDNQIDSNTGTVRCKAVFPNEDNALFPNQFVNARLLVDTKQSTVIVPAAAIQRSPQSTFVYVVKDDSAVESRNVTIGPGEGDAVSIASGLAPGEVVVVEGVDRLQQGTKVQARMAGVSQERRQDGSQGRRQDASQEGRQERQQERRQERRQE